MTIINCSYKCIYQQNGNCTLDSITMNSNYINNDCFYFQEETIGKSTNFQEDLKREYY